MSTMAFFPAVKPTSYFEALMARLFGVKRVVSDGKTEMTMYYWRGRYYLVAVSP